MTPQLCLGTSAKSAEGWIQGKAPGSIQGKTRHNVMSMMGPFSKGPLIQSGRLQQQTEFIMMYSNDLKHVRKSVVIFIYSIPRSSFWHVLDLVISTYCYFLLIFLIW